MEAQREFPSIPIDFEKFVIKPNPFNLLTEQNLKLQNHSKQGILFKVKTNSNKRIKIEECADVLKPGNQILVPVSKLVENVENDNIFVIYTLVGPQWLDDNMSAFRCWERVKKQGISTKCVEIKLLK